MIKPNNCILEQRFRMRLHDSHVYMLVKCLPCSEKLTGAYVSMEAIFVNRNGRVMFITALKIFLKLLKGIGPVKMSKYLKILKTPCFLTRKINLVF